MGHHHLFDLARPEAATRLRAEAAADGTSPSVALTVKLEAALAVERLRAHGIADPIMLLDRIADAQRPIHALSSAEADYARSLTLDRFGGHEDDLTIPVLGPDRSAQQYPFASLLRSGATLAMGSDWSVTTANPLEQIEVAVTRVDPERRDVTPFLPAESLSLT